MYNYPNIAALARWLVSRPKECVTAAENQSTADRQRLLDDIMTDVKWETFITKEMTPPAVHNYYPNIATLASWLVSPPAKSMPTAEYQATADS
jgi:hypothetical protein